MANGCQKSITLTVMTDGRHKGAQVVGVASNIKRRERANDLALAYTVAIGTLFSKEVPAGKMTARGMSYHKLRNLVDEMRPTIH